jgi:hypothetical protein
MWRLAFCRACSACRRALRLDCYRASCPCPGRRWHLSRRRWTCRSRSGSASSNSPWSTTYRGSQNLPPGRRSWSHDRLARHLVHMRRFRKASARPQLRLLRASWPFLSVDHDNSLSKAGFRDKLRQAERGSPNFSPPAIGFRRIYQKGLLFERVHRSAGYYCNRWSGTQFPAPCGATSRLQRAIASFQRDETPRSGGIKIPLPGSERDPAFLASNLPAHRLFKTEFTTVSLRFSATLAREL